VNGKKRHKETSQVNGVGYFDIKHLQTLSIPENLSTAARPRRLVRFARFRSHDLQLA
jgi:hypothetical protein